MKFADVTADRSAGKREPADGQIAGVVALAPGDAPGTLDLNKLFIEPRHIRGGVGRALFAVAEARQRGAERLTILPDPNAAGFYERNGAVRTRKASSDAVWVALPESYPPMPRFSSGNRLQRADNTVRQTARPAVSTSWTGGSNRS